MVSDGSDTFGAQVCETDSSGYPTSTCTDLTPPGTFDAGTLSFTAPANATLSKGTTYAVLLTPAGAFRFGYTSQAGEDTGSESDWSIADSFDFNSGNWTTYSSVRAVRIAIKGHEASGPPTPSTDATLSGGTVKDGSTTLVTFASGTTAYTASVANGVDEVTFAPTTNHAEATVEYLLGDAGDEDDLEDADAMEDDFQVALAVGANRIVVSVTAEDGTTYLDYVVTVTRAAAMTPTCTLNTGDLWCGVVMVEDIMSGGSTAGHGFAGTTGDIDGTPDDKDFTVPSNSNEYTITSLLVGAGSNSGNLILQLDEVLAAGEQATLELSIDGESDPFPLSTATAVGTAGYRWSGTGLDWSMETTVTVRLREEDPPTLSVADAAGDEGDDKVVFTVTLSKPYYAATRATWTASIETGDTAVAADLGTTKTGTVSIAVNATTATFEVPVADDTTDENDETFTVTLSSPYPPDVVKLAADPTATGTIEDDDAAVVTNCMLNTGDVWCGTVTVGTSVNTGGVTIEHGFDSPSSLGSLTDNSGDQTFTYGTDPTTTYEVTRASVGAGSLAGNLEFGLRGQVPGGNLLQALAADHLAKLALHVDGSTTPFVFSSATSHNARTGYLWQNSGLDWSSGTPVTVRLRELPDAPTGFEAGVGNAQVDLTWDAPATGANITRHEYRFKTGGGSYPTTWTQIAMSAPGGTNQASYTVTGLTNEIAHTFELRAWNDSGGSAAVEDGPVTPTPGICDRTQQVRDALLDHTGVDDCKAVTVANLASVRVLLLTRSALGITALQSGDFAGLTAVTAVAIGNQTGLTALPSDVFSGLSTLGNLTLSDNSLGSLPEDVFSGLTALKTLELKGNDLTALPDEVFSGLSSLNVLRLEDNDLTALPDDVFSGLTALDALDLDGNDLQELPAGVFTGLTGLVTLTLGDNPGTDDVLPLTVTVEKVGTDQARAEVLAGAPFAVDFTPTVANGALPASDTKLGVAAGSVEGTAETVTRTSGTTEPVTVDIDLTTQPSLPSGHTGYEFVKAASGLPKTILSATTNNDPVFASTTETRTVPENSAVGTNVGAVIPAATDADTGDTPTYSMGGADAASFAFDASTRQITTIANVDYNHEAMKNSYSVTVTASDGNGGAATVAVTIDVTDVAEQPAKPEPPTVTATARAAGSLDVDWVKPDLNGGPDITGYEVKYQRRASGSWSLQEDWPHSGTGTTTTITGLEPDSDHRVQVLAKNGETDSAFSDYSAVVKTNAAPTIVNRRVAVTSTPVLATDTYGAGERIEVSVTFSEAVDATPATDFQMSVGGNKLVPLVSGSGTATLVFGYTVAPGDEDLDGIFIGAEQVTLVGDRNGNPQTGEITSVATGVPANIDHAGPGTQSGHKVDGTRSIVSVEVTSTPRLETDTYGAGETILLHGDLHRRGGRGRDPGSGAPVRQQRGKTGRPRVGRRHDRAGLRLHGGVGRRRQQRPFPAGRKRLQQPRRPGAARYRRYDQVRGDQHRRPALLARPRDAVGPQGGRLADPEQQRPGVRRCVADAEGAGEQPEEHERRRSYTGGHGRGQRCADLLVGGHGRGPFQLERLPADLDAR